jgi:3-oxoadipate enol-lactonase
VTTEQNPVESPAVERIAAGGSTFGYREFGAGEPALLFMHGYLGSSAVWSALLPLLAARRRCIAIDARGVGDSDRSPDGYTLDGWVADVLAVADALGLDRFDYVAHSLGGLTGYRLALDHPERLNHLVLVCPSPAGPPRAGREAFAAFRAAWADGDAAALAALLAAVSVRLPDAAHTAERGRTALTATAGHVDALLDAVADLDLRPALAELTVPTLMLLGAADPALPAGLADFGRLPDATLDVMSGVGHVPQLECPAAVADVIERFLVDGPLTFARLMARAAAR